MFKDYKALLAGDITFMGPQLLYYLTIIGYDLPVYYNMIQEKCSAMLSYTMWYI